MAQYSLSEFSNDNVLKLFVRFCFCCFLYFLQGLPLGLASETIPYILGKYGAYSSLSVFSLALYPYSLKLFWSPLVDSLWWRKFGRRKCWIVPTQFFCGCILLSCSYFVNNYFEGDARYFVSSWKFAVFWGILIFGCATQDIALDGWALSLFPSTHISYSSTAQAVGLSLGIFVSSTLFLFANSVDNTSNFLNILTNYPTIFSLSGLMKVSGYLFLFAIPIICCFDDAQPSVPPMKLKKAYELMWRVFCLQSVKGLLIVHVIAKIGFSANDTFTNLKFLEYGILQKDMALISLSNFPLEIGLSYVFERWQRRYSVMKIWQWAFIVRLFAAILAQTIIWYLSCHSMSGKSNTASTIILIAAFQHGLAAIGNIIMFLSISAFHSRVADPTIGGTYITLLATFCNLGGIWPKFFILKLAELLTHKICSQISNSTRKTGGKCDSESSRRNCEVNDGVCVNSTDGFLFVNFICIFIGALLFVSYIKNATSRLAQLHLSEWRTKLNE